VAWLLFGAVCWWLLKRVGLGPKMRGRADSR
jgi:hypothetical protein